MSDFFVHESSYVDDGATVAGPVPRSGIFATSCPVPQIGEGCSLGQNVVVMSGVRVGNHVKVQNNVSLYQGVVLEDDTFCGPSCVFTNVVHTAEPRVAARGRVRRDDWSGGAPRSGPMPPSSAV